MTDPCGSCNEETFLTELRDMELGAAAMEQPATTADAKLKQTMMLSTTATTEHSTATEDVTPKQTSLLGLPRELRDMIYDFVYTPTTIRKGLYKYRAMPPRLFAVCKQIRAETSTGDPACRRGKYSEGERKEVTIRHFWSPIYHGDRKRSAGKQQQNVMVETPENPTFDRVYIYDGYGVVIRAQLRGALPDRGRPHRGLVRLRNTEFPWEPEVPGSFGGSVNGLESVMVLIEATRRMRSWNAVDSCEVLRRCERAGMMWKKIVWDGDVGQGQIVERAKEMTKRGSGWS